MRAIAVLTRLYLVESVRRQFHLVTLFLAILILILPVVVNTFGMSGFERVPKDFGLTLIGAAAVLLSLYLGSTAVPGEIEQRTHLALLSKPLPRLHYLLGKFSGICIVLWGSLLCLGVCLLGSLAMVRVGFDPTVLVAVCFMATEACVLAALCLLFSVVSSPVTAAVAGAAVYLIGGLSDTFITFFFSDGDSVSIQGTLVQGLKLFIPRFDLFSIKAAVVHGNPLSASYLAAVMTYGILWVAILVLVADWLFDRRDL